MQTCIFTDGYMIMHGRKSSRLLCDVDMFRFKGTKEEGELYQTVQGGLSGYLVSETPEHYRVWVRLLRPVWGLWGYLILGMSSSPSLGIVGLSEYVLWSIYLCGVVGDGQCC